MEITQTARVYVKYGETLAFGLCNDYGEENERIGLFTSYEELATYCREKVLTGRPPRRIPPEALAAIAELARQGNNLNQLARIANSEKSMAGVVPRLVGLLDFYEEMVKRIKGYFHDR